VRSKGSEEGRQCATQGRAQCRSVQCVAQRTAVCRGQQCTRMALRCIKQCDAQVGAQGRTVPRAISAEGSAMRRVGQCAGQAMRGAGNDAADGS
jgi:hypothetical protein